MQTSMSEMRAVKAAASVIGVMTARMPSFDDTGAVRAQAEFTSAKVVREGADRRKTERPHHDEIAPLLSVVREVHTKRGTIKVWELLDSRTSKSINCITSRDDLEFAERWLKAHNERITVSQSFYGWNQAD